MSTESQLRGALRVLDMLADPHGLDRYTELVRAAPVRHDLRAEVTIVNARQSGSVARLIARFALPGGRPSA